MLLATILFFSGCADAPATSPSDNAAQQNTAQQQAEAQRQAREQAEAQRFAEQKAEAERQQRQQEAYRIAITELMEADDRVGHSFRDYGQIANGMRGLDLSKCPHDFMAAYVDYIHVWEKAAEIQRLRQQLKSDENVKAVLASEVLRDIFGSEGDAHPVQDAAEAADKLSAAAHEAASNIGTKLDELEHIAATYGAKLP